MIPDSVKTDALAHALREYPRESCGLVIKADDQARYLPCRNTAESSKQFIMDPMDYVRAEATGRVLAVVHSHPDIGPRPSQADMVACELSGLPWFIVSVPGGSWDSIRPDGYRAPLVGREFSHGILDCYSLIRDWFFEERGIVLPDFDRSEEWWKKGGDLYLENFRKAGFESHVGPLERGDGILMQVGAKVTNHAAVYIGNGKILHHLQNRLSTRDVFGGYWQRCTRLVVRYKGAT